MFVDYVDPLKVSVRDSRVWLLILRYIGIRAISSCF